MKPCKFCNGEAEIIDNGYSLVNNKSIHCKKCGMRLYLPWCTDRETAGKMWDELVGNNGEAKEEAKDVIYQTYCDYKGKPVYYTAFCPKCDSPFAVDGIDWKCNYCPKCGQRLKWENNDE